MNFTTKHAKKRGCKVNKLNRFTAALILSFICTLAPLSAAENDVEFNIRFIDRRIYYVETDPVYVQLTIANNSPAPYHFKLADERAFSVGFDIRAMTNRPLSDADSFIRKRTTYQHIYFREISIESGESFSFVEDLRDYADLKQPGSFRVQARVYPELYRTANSPAIASNYLNLNMRPPLIPGPDGIPLEMDVATGAVLVRQRMPPDQVVEYMIRARQESQWEKFFLYLDLEAMLSRDAFQKRRFTAENEEGRRRMMSEYRQNLQSGVMDGNISVIPTTFTMERCQYNADEGTVIILARFRESTFTELRRYTYYLVRKDEIWMIVDYSVTALGTEPNPRR
jgi:hypothetical protein